MNFLHLKYFLMVAEELNITRAAERLYISQQSLSSHISNMERELNVKLFTRSPKLALTYAGDQLVQTATQIIDLYSQYLSKVGDINRHYLGVLRVGISHTCGLALLPEILPRFRSEFPMAEFSLFEGNSTQLEDELLEYQRSLARVAFAGHWGHVAELQKKLVRSLAAKALAVRHVVQNDSEPGIDGVRWQTDGEKMRAALSLTSKGYHARPYRRFLLQDGDKERRINVPRKPQRRSQGLSLHHRSG